MPQDSDSIVSTGPILNQRALTKFINFNGSGPADQSNAGHSSYWLEIRLTMAVVFIKEGRPHFAGHKILIKQNIRVRPMMINIYFFIRCLFNKSELAQQESG